MKIELKKITIRELFNGFENSEEEGVVGFAGKLNIRPKYQREFIYNDSQQQAVINSILNDFPLSIMYWVETNDGYELLDGQQRTLSICGYLNSTFALNHRFAHNLDKDELEKILNYNLLIYICSDGTNNEKLEWFKTINIAGERLTNQELRNAIYAGAWTTDAKRYFSKTNCVSHDLGKNYLKGEPIRQAYLETAISWISKGNIEEYMGMHQHDSDALDLWSYFQRVIAWVNKLFPNYRREMKGIQWGLLYNEYKDNEYDPQLFETVIKHLMIDEDVTKKSGIYPYLFTKDARHLNIRAFSANQKREAYEKQKGICKGCSEHFSIDEMEADHIKPWHDSGQTISDNCQMLCVKCNRSKSNN